MSRKNSVTRIENERSHFRIKIHLDATLRMKSEKFKARIIDMSSGGLKMECSHIIPVDEDVTLHFMVNHYRIAVRCKIVRSEKGEDDKYYYGAKYIFVSAPDLKAINSFLFEIQALTRWQ